MRIRGVTGYRQPVLPQPPTRALSVQQTALKEGRERSVAKYMVRVGQPTGGRRRALTRPQLPATGGGGEGGTEWQPGLLRLPHPATHPPTHPHEKIFPWGKSEIYQRVPK